MVKKQIKELNKNEVFVDSLGCELRVVSVEVLPESGIPRGIQWAKVEFVSQPSGRLMHMNYRANRIVEVLHCEPNIVEQFEAFVKGEYPEYFGKSS